MYEFYGWPKGWSTVGERKSENSTSDERRIRIFIHTHARFVRAAVASSGSLFFTLQLPLVNRTSWSVSLHDKFSLSCKKKTGLSLKGLLLGGKLIKWPIPFTEQSLKFLLLSLSWGEISNRRVPAKKQKVSPLSHPMSCHVCVRWLLAYLTTKSFL